MEFTEKQSLAEKVGTNVGYLTALTIFTTIFYYVTGKAGLHGFKTETFPVFIAAVFIASAGLSKIQSKYVGV
jgi:hypothetical protein